MSMETKQLTEVSLGEICHGALEEIFDDIFKKIINDIDDDRKKAIAPRKLVLTVEFIPNETREHVNMKATGDVKLAPMIPYESMGYVSEEPGGTKIFEAKRQVQYTFDELGDYPEVDNVSRLRGEK